MKLHLQLSLDALGPTYQADKPYYALLVSAALEPEANEAVEPTIVDRLLRIWNWMPLSELSVYGRRLDFTDKWTPLPHTVVTDSSTPEGLDHLRARLNVELDGQLKPDIFAPDDFTWHPAPVTRSIEEKRLTPGTQPRRGRDWRSFLTHVGTYPGGLGIHLRLTVFFHLHAPTPDDYIVVAAPVVQLEREGLVARPATPTSAPNDPLEALDIKIEASTAPKQVFRWKYEGHDTLAIDAYVNRPKPLPKAEAKRETDHVIDLTSLWRRQRPLGPETNWLAQLAERMTSPVDLPTTLLKYLEALGQSAVPNFFQGVFRKALFEAVRPAILQERVAPSGASLQKAILFVHAKPEDFDFSDTTMPAGWEPDLPAPAGNASAYLGVLDEYWRRVATTSRLADRVLLLWERAYRGPEDWSVVKGRLTPALNIDVLRERLLLQTVGPLWRALFPSGAMPVGSELPLLEDGLVEQVRTFANEVLDFMPEEYQRVLKQEVAAVFVAPGDQVSADPTSDGVTIQIDRIGGSGRLGGQDDHDDYLRRLSGTGVLMRRKGEADWRALNMATLAIRPDDPKAEPLKVGGAMAFPVRFQYTQGVRQGFISYQNQPLVAESPWALLGSSPNPAKQSTAGITTPLFKLLSPYGSKGSAPKLPRLQYGKKYETAVYYFGTTGALPSELSEGTGTSAARPWRFQLPATALAADRITEVHYLRRCPIGPLRIEEDRVTRRPFPPPLPGRVFPLTPDLLRPASALGSLLSRAPDAPQLPLALVLPSDSGPEWDASKGVGRSTAFLLRPPSLDVKVWERWQDDDAQGRAAVIAEHFTLLNAHASGARKNEDATIDDSAVVAFKVAFERVDAQGSVQPGAQFDFGPAAAPNGLKREQRVGRRVIVASSRDRTPAAALDTTTGALHITIPDGEIWRVDFVPVVDGLDRFIDDQRRNGKSFRDWLTEPTSIHVEVALPLFTSSNHATRNTALHQSLMLTIADANPEAQQRDVPNPGLQVKVTRQPLGAAAPLIHRTEVLIQRWRWDGRPVYEDAAAAVPVSGLPFTAAGELSEDFVNDGALFADRRDSDYLVMPGAADLSRPDSSAVLAHSPFSVNAGVLYYRVAARAYSRYEGLLHDGHRLDSSLVDARAPRRWRRYAVPLRWQERVPKPLVKLVIPLTETIAGRGPLNAPGWLVLVDEPWYSDTLGGLGEYLESHLDHVALPDNQEETRPQAGADPIVAMPEDPLANLRLKLERPTGAFGWTFDSDTTAPLYVKSCFYQSPAMHEQLPDDLSFYFLKLRFRRVLAGADATRPRDALLRRSELTDPYWVQVLPPANRWRVASGGPITWVSSDDLTLAPNAAGLRLRGAEVTRVAAISTTSAFAAFRVYALITRRIFDAFGRRDQEAFVTIRPVETLHQTAIDDPGVLRLRLIEVQFRLPLPSGVDEMAPAGPKMLTALIEALFKGGLEAPGTSAPLPRRDAAARIIRMSPPIDTE